MCHKESALMGEITQAVAMKERKNVLVDGSLRDYKWQETQFEKVRQHPNGYHIALLVVTADHKVVLERIKKRGDETGRFVEPQLAVHF